MIESDFIFLILFGNNLNFHNMQDINNRKLFLVTKIERWKDVFTFEHQFLSRFIFRGQSDSGWKLETSLERHAEKFYPKSEKGCMLSFEEERMLREFKWKYPLYSNILPCNEDVIEWLAIMQHHGAPTRLLDFSYSLYIALFFATIEHNGNCSSVWAINKSVINHDFIHNYRSLNNNKMIRQEALDEEIRKHVNNDINNMRYQYDYDGLLYIVTPKNCIERLSRQQGVFLVPSNIRTPFCGILNSCTNTLPTVVPFSELKAYLEKSQEPDDISVLKIDIPKQFNFDIAKSLRAMNITAEMLFPGIDGLSKSLQYMSIPGGWGEA